MAPYEALYGRKYRSLVHWDEVGERKCLGSELVEQATEANKKIQETMKTSQTHQKSYANQRHQTLEFQVREHIFFKIFPM